MDRRRDVARGEWAPGVRGLGPTRDPRRAARDTRSADTQHPANTRVRRGPRYAPATTWRHRFAEKAANDLDSKISTRSTDLSELSDSFDFDNYIAEYQKSEEKNYNISEPCAVLLWFKSTVEQNWREIRGSAVGYCVFFLLFGYYQSWLYNHEMKVTFFYKILFFKQFYCVFKTWFYRESDFYGRYSKQLAKVKKEEEKRRAKNNIPLLPK